MAKLDCRLAKVKSPLGSFLMTYLTQKLHRLQTPSKKIIFDILNGKLSVGRDITLLNAGAAIYISGLANDIDSGILIAADMIDQGKAMEKLNELITSSND